MKITIYSTPTCHYCNLAKDFLTKNDIEFVTHDVKCDLDKRKEMMELSGQMGVPVITVDDRVLLGFDEEMMKSILDL